MTYRYDGSSHLSLGDQMSWRQSYIFAHAIGSYSCRNVHEATGNKCTDGYMPIHYIYTVVCLRMQHAEN